MASALAATVRDVSKLVEDYAPGASCRLNLAVADGDEAVVSRFSNGVLPSQSLYLDSGREYVCGEDGIARMIETGLEGGAAVISSEPLSQDPGWHTVPDDHLVLVRRGRPARMLPLEYWSAERRFAT
jgi:predicted glutamine amidotransferase